MTEKTVVQVEERETDVTYCDICGGTEPPLTEHGEYHFHKDCTDDVFIEDAVVDTPTEDPSSRVLPNKEQLRSSVPPLPSLPEERVPPALRGMGAKAQALLTQTIPRILFWPVGGLWWAEHTDLFGDDVKHMDTMQVYLMNTAMWLVSVGGLLLTLT